MVGHGTVAGHVLDLNPTHHKLDHGIILMDNKRVRERQRKGRDTHQRMDKDLVEEGIGERNLTNQIVISVNEISGEGREVGYAREASQRHVATETLDEDEITRKKCC